MTRQRPAPVYLNLFRIRFPVGAVTSIAHRMTGVLLALVFPLAVYLLDLSLRGPDGFGIATEWLGSMPARLFSVLLAWSLLHHFLSGIRFLLIDLELGVNRTQARISAWLVNLLGLCGAFTFAWWIL